MTAPRPATPAKWTPPARLIYESGQGSIDNGTTYGAGWTFRVNRETDSPLGAPWERDQFAAEVVRRYNAAPALAEACEMALASLEDAEAGYPDREKHEDPRDTIARLRAALALAKGGSL